MFVVQVGSCVKIAECLGGRVEGEERWLRR
jgi:hypothetical protein